MSTYSIIKNWFQNSLDYSKGVELLSNYCNNKNLVGNLRKRESDYNVEKLRYELDKILENAKKETTTLRERSAEPDASNESNIEPVKENAKEEFLPVVSNVGTSNIHHNSDLLFLEKGITKKRNDLYARRNFLHSQLSGPIANKERLKLAKEIIDIQPLISKYNDHLNYIAENNATPPELIKSKLTAEDLRQQLNAKTYISKYRKKLKTAKTIKEKQKYQALLDKYETRIA
jgi:hypothetical protein